MKEWFERGGFLYDITKEYGRLRNNSAALLDEISINLKGLNEDEAKFISCRIPESVESVNPFECVYQYTWRKNENCVQDEKRKLELKSFANINFAYKLPDDWEDDWEDDLEKDENLLMRYIVSQWGAGNKKGEKIRAYKLYWPENEQLHYPIFEIIKNYPTYNGWEYVPKASNSAVKWLLQEPNSKNTLTTDIASSKFSLPFPENFINSIKFENKGSTDAFLKKRKHKGIMESLKKEGAEGATALLRVLYTIGNIIPVARNFSGGNNGDNLTAKLKCAKKIIDKPTAKIKNKKVFVGLFETLYSEVENPQEKYNHFIIDHYFQDYVQRDCKGNYSDPIVITDCVVATKLIIQRGYRIHYQYKRNNDGSIKLNRYKKPIINKDLFDKDLSFKDEAKKKVKDAFKAVGIPENKLDIIEKPVVT